MSDERNRKSWKTAILDNPTPPAWAIKELRKALGDTQTEFAERVGAPVQEQERADGRTTRQSRTVQQWENNDMSPGVDYAYELREITKRFMEGLE